MVCDLEGTPKENPLKGRQARSIRGAACTATAGSITVPQTAARFIKSGQTEQGQRLSTAAKMFWESTEQESGCGSLQGNIRKTEIIAVIIPF